MINGNDIWDHLISIQKEIMDAFGDCSFERSISLSKNKRWTNERIGIKTTIILNIIHMK